MSSLCHPQLLATLLDTTCLIKDLVEIIGNYWFELHVHYHPFLLDHNVTDFYDCIDGQEMEITGHKDFRTVLLREIYKSEIEWDRCGCILGKQILKRNNDVIFIFRLVMNGGNAMWKSSTSLQILLKFMPSLHYQQFLAQQYAVQAEALCI